MTTLSLERMRESTLSHWTIPHDDLPVLASYSRPIAPIDPLEFLCRGEGQRFYWSSDDGDKTFAGWGVEAELVAYGLERFADIEDELERLFGNLKVDVADLPCGGPRVYGGFSFRPEFEPSGIWSAFPPAYFALPSHVLVRIGGQHWLLVNRLAQPGESAAEAMAEAQAQFETLNSLAPSPSAREDDDENEPQVLNVDYPLGREGWQRQVTRATDRMRAGELEKVVLARTADLTFDAPVDPLSVLDNLDARYPHAFRFLIEPLPGHAFTGATPELIAELHGQHLTTGALAGSTARGETEADDDRLARELLDSPKNRYEHALVVDALRQQLAAFSDDIRVPDEPTIYRLGNIQHLFTPIAAELRRPTSILQIVEALHPTPALGGTPQNVAVETIHDTEIVSRGWYAAPVGWIDWQGAGQFSVAIRSAVSAGNQARLYAGAGIVADSEPDKEWDETGLKFKPMLDAFGANAHVTA